MQYLYTIEVFIFKKYFLVRNNSRNVYNTSNTLDTKMNFNYLKCDFYNSTLIEYV